MAILSIIKYPDPKLKLVATPVEVFDSALVTLCSDLLETMYKFDGIGMSATQVNVQQRVFVLDLSEKQNQPMCFVNPVITNRIGNINFEEGCISFPDIYAKIKRAAEITLQYQDIEGNQHSLHAEDLLAVCIQHELDHLDGITFYDHLSPLKKKLLRRKLEKV